MATRIPNNIPKDKWYDHRPTKLTIAVAGVVIVGIGIYFVVPRVFPPETGTHGVLPPAANTGEVKPDQPKRACDRMKSQFPQAVEILLGSNVALVPPNEKMNVLRVGSCALVSAEARNGEVLFNADIFDENHELIARLEKNEFHLVPGKYAYQERSNDWSKLTVYGKQGKPLFSVHYLSKTTTRLSGAFYCADGTSVVVPASDDPVAVNSRSKSGGLLGGNCTANANGFFVRPDGTGL